MKSTTILIPTMNEVENIRILLQKLMKYKDQAKIVFIDDSTDEQFIKMKSVIKKFPSMDIKIVKGLKSGVGVAVRIGIKHVSTKYFVVMMGDLSDDPDDFEGILNKLNEGFGIVFGSRFSKGSKIDNYPFFKFIANRLTNILIALAFLIKSHDITGAYSGYRTVFFKNCHLKSRGFSIFAELPLKGIVGGLSYCEIPVVWRNRISGKSNMKLFRVGFQYWKIILELLVFKYLFRYRNNL